MRINDPAHNERVYGPKYRLMKELDALQTRLDAAEAALNCEHNHDRSDEERHADLWEFVEHQGKTWNRCQDCGLLELWEGGMFVKAVLVEQEKQQP